MYSSWPAVRFCGQVYVLGSAFSSDTPNVSVCHAVVGFRCHTVLVFVCISADATCACLFITSYTITLFMCGVLRLGSPGGVGDYVSYCIYGVLCSAPVPPLPLYFACDLCRTAAALFSSPPPPLKHRGVRITRTRSSMFHIRSSLTYIVLKCMYVCSVEIFVVSLYVHYSYFEVLKVLK